MLPERPAQPVAEPLEMQMALEGEGGEAVLSVYLRASEGP